MRLFAVADVYCLPMRAAMFATIIGWSVGMLIPTALARESLTLNEKPETYNDVEQELTRIDPYLSGAQCGGHLNETVQDSIATVSGLPGRNGDWNGAILSGLASRRDENGNNDLDDDFIFPDTTRGLSTACSPEKDSINKKVWRPKDGGFPEEVEEVDVTYPHPRFSDPSCRWRPKRDGDFQERAPDIPLNEIDTYNNLDYGELDEEPQDRQSPGNCMDFCTMLNSYQFYDCVEIEQREFIDPENPENPANGAFYPVCTRWANRYLCTDQEATDADAACQTNTGDRANAIRCVDSECRCEQDGGPDSNGCVENPGTRQEENPVYYSYYRQYNASYARKSIRTDGGNDRSSDSGQVACYGFYEEFDPKNHRTEDKDRRCVMNMNVVDRKQTQTGKAEFGQNRDDPDSSNPDNAENTRDDSFNDEEDLWYEKLSGGFSLLSEKLFTEDYGKDLTNVYLDSDALDDARMKATRQLSTQTFASGSYIRSFDDSGTGRIVSVWWQKMQSDVASLLHPPVVRIVLPAGAAIGIDPNDPYFETDETVLSPLQKYDDRLEVQIAAGEDMLGAAIGIIERANLLRIREEKIPLIVPLGSPTEFRAKAESWCGWVMRRNGTQDCNNAPADVRALIDTLEEYADNIDKIRLLRAELPQFVAKILALQRSVTDPLREWMTDNIETYRDYLEIQTSVRASLSDEWRQLQEAYESFGNKTNMPWCMNQRFTLPVYSLLDPWLPSREQAGKISAAGLPVIPITSEADIVIDLSAVGSMSGSFVLPVLDPVQVRVTDFPNPPLPNENYSIPQNYPDFPSVDAIRDAMRDAADQLPDPPRDAPVFPALSLPQADLAQIGEAVNALRRANEIITGSDSMDERYDLFWKSIGPLSPNEPGQDDRNGIKQMKENMECYSWNDKTCQHVEMDLRERLMRIGSRPLVFLNEDKTSNDILRGFGGPCIAQSDVCTPMHPEEGGETYILEVIGARRGVEYLDELRQKIRDATMAEPIGDIPEEDYPRYGASGSQLLPPLAPTPSIRLFQSSSSSSTR